jgi:hypothetical protein
MRKLPTAHATNACVKFLDFAHLLFYYVKNDIKEPFAYTLVDFFRLQMIRSRKLP